MDEFEKLYHAYVDAVFRYSVHCVGRREIAEEITSDVFLALYQNLERIDVRQLPAWLYTVARNRAMDYWRRQALEERYAATPAAMAAQPDSLLGGSLFDNHALNPVHRVCLVLRYIQGMNRAEIARYTGLSELQIKGHLQYARQILRKQIRQGSK